LTNPFPQGKQLLAHAISNPGTSAEVNQEGENSSDVYMMGSHINVNTRECGYGEMETSKGKFVPKTTNPLQFE